VAAGLGAFVLAGLLTACGSDGASTGGTTTTSLCANRSTSRPQTGTSDTGPDAGGAGKSGGSTGAGTQGGGDDRSSPASQSGSGVASDNGSPAAQATPSSTTPSTAPGGQATTTSTTRGQGRLKQSGGTCDDYATTEDGGTGTGG
jgi:hypothetical protein